MIAFLPALYPDELVYSWLSRYHVRSGNLSFRHTAEELYVSRQTVPDVCFLDALRPEVFEVMSRYCTIEALVLEHTMFTAYGRFLPKERKREAYEALCQMQGNFHNLLAIPKREKGKARFLRYCPVCAEQDRKAYGEAYWHRCHQIPGIWICHEHGCFLKESTVSMGKKESSGFYTAEGAGSVK